MANYVCALPILMALSMYAQQKMMQPNNATGPQADQQKMMQYFMMGFFFLLFNSFPSGLNLYYTLFNILTIAQQKLTKKRKSRYKTNKNIALSVVFIMFTKHILFPLLFFHTSFTRKHGFFKST